MAFMEIWKRKTSAGFYPILRRSSLGFSLEWRWLLSCWSPLSTKLYFWLMISASRFSFWHFLCSSCSPLLHPLIRKKVLTFLFTFMLLTWNTERWRRRILAVNEGWNFVLDLSSKRVLGPNPKSQTSCDELRRKMTFFNWLSTIEKKQFSNFISPAGKVAKMVKFRVTSSGYSWKKNLIFWLSFFLAKWAIKFCCWNHLSMSFHQRNQSWRIFCTNSKIID